MDQLMTTDDSVGEYGGCFLKSKPSPEELPPAASTATAPIQDLQIDQTLANLPAADLDGNDEDVNEREGDLQEFIGDGQNKYDLRPQTRELKPSFGRTWLDDDKTGEYDPAEEQRKLRRRPKRPNPLLKLGFCPWDLEDTEDQSEPPRERAPKVNPKLEVTLSFKSEAGKAAFGKHVRDLPIRCEADDARFSERRLRRRDSGVGLSNPLKTRPVKKSELPEDIPDDLTGHPIARGCWQCVSISIRCPLLDDNRAWPCTACTDDNNECELITPPTYKRACKHCKSKRTGCSYTYTSDHEGPCEECARIGGRCVAGPAKETLRERISYDRDWENDPLQQPKDFKPKKLPSCQRCREREQPCSFGSGDKNDVCTACDMADETCLPELDKPQGSRKRKRQAKTKATIVIEDGDEGSDMPQTEQKSKKQGEKPQHIIIPSGPDDSDNPTTQNPSKQSKQNTRTKQPNTTQGDLTTITTKFAHPIIFNYEGPQHCHFCTDLRFAMFGLGATDVEVVVWNDGRGLEEISGGHRGRGVERTRMCVQCTTGRIPVLLCGQHELQPLNAPTLPPIQALNALLTKSLTGSERWCSLCPSLAKYECCTQGPHGKGCGLQLCETCMVPVTASGGDLQRVLKGLKDEPSEGRVLGLRADWEFLKVPGLLMRYILWESGQGGQSGSV